MKKHTAGSIEKRRPTAMAGGGRSTGTAGLNLEQLVTLWHLQRGGVPMAEAIDLAGAKLPVPSGETATANFDALISSPLAINGTVRCQCGALLVAVPCVACGHGRERYRSAKPNER